MTNKNKQKTNNNNHEQMHKERKYKLPPPKTVVEARFFWGVNRICYTYVSKFNA